MPPLFPTSSRLSPLLVLALSCASFSLSGCATTPAQSAADGARNPLVATVTFDDREVPFADPILDLAALERHALASHGTIGQIEHEQRAMTALADGARAWPGARLSYRESIVEVETRVGPQERTFALEQMIPWPGVRGAREQKARLRAAMTGDQAEDARRAVLARVRTLWADLDAVERSITVERATLETIDALLTAARERVATGRGSTHHVVRIEIERARLENVLETTLARRIPLRAALRAAAGLPAGASLPTPNGTDRRALPGDRDTLLATLIASDPRLARAARAIELAETDRRLADLDRYPKLGVGVTTIITGDAVQPNVRGSGDDPWIVGLTLEIPIDRRGVRAARRAAEDRRDGALFAHAQLLRDRTAHLDAILFERDDLERQIALHRDALLPRAKESLRLATNTYASGGGALTDSLDATRVLLDLRLALARAEARRLAVDADLRALVGESPSPANGDTP